MKESIMRSHQSSVKIRKVAKDLDNAVEKHDIESILSCFLDDCEVEIFGIILRGKGHLKKALNWLYEMIGEIKFKPIIIMVAGDVFFEEFILKGNKDGKKLEARATEVLIYKDYKVKTLRLYLDILQIADVLAKGFIEKFVVKMINKKILKGLK
jgi:ketosteroid isomerase-like protein